MAKELLAGVKVLEVGQLIAAPFAGCMLGAFGAEVIKVEPPKNGDPMRTWRKLHKGTSLWWYSISRNKKSVTLNLNHPEGPGLLKKLVAEVDVLIENFRPGKMEEWGLSFEELKKINPRLIMVRVSGYGQNGPYAKRPGFASVAEGIGGLRYITGEPDRPPVRTGVSLGDTLAGLHAAYGALMALYSREKTGEGTLIDVSIYESVFNMMESMLSEYDMFKLIRERTGAKLSGIVPTNTYLCKDGKYIIIGGNGDGIFKRLMTAIERKDLAEDPRLAQNPGRVEHEALIDEAIESYTKKHTFEEVFTVLEKADVPTGPIYSIEDISKDPHYKARGMFSTVTLPEGEPLQVPTIAPIVPDAPSSVKWVGPTLGEHNEEIYLELLGVGKQRYDTLRGEGVI